MHACTPQIIHQDIKPANVLIDDYNNYAITDFGISSQRGGKHGFYFDEDNGMMRTGRTSISNDEFDEQEFYFATTGTIGKRGGGLTGVKDGRVYENGLMLRAEDGMKYQIVEIRDNDVVKRYLVNESGKVKTSGTVKDGDGVKYKVTKSGSSYNIEIVND